MAGIAQAYGAATSAILTDVNTVNTSISKLGSTATNATKGVKQLSDASMAYLLMIARDYGVHVLPDTLDPGSPIHAETVHPADITNPLDTGATPFFQTFAGWLSVPPPPPPPPPADTSGGGTP